MAEKQVFIGSVGPFIFDDLDSYSDGQSYIGVYSPDSPLKGTNVITSNLSTNVRIVASNASKELEEINDLSIWVKQGSGGISVVNNLDGTVTINLPQDLTALGSPTFAGVNITGDYVFTSATHIIRADTVDASDSKRVILAGGGLASTTRGAVFQVIGNQFGAGLGGAIVADIGGEGDGRFFDVRVSGVSKVRVDSTGLLTAQGGITSNGDILANASSIIINFPGTGKSLLGTPESNPGVVIFNYSTAEIVSRRWDIAVDTLDKLYFKDNTGTTSILFLHPGGGMSIGTGDLTSGSTLTIGGIADINPALGNAHRGVELVNPGSETTALKTAFTRFGAHSTDLADMLYNAYWTGTAWANDDDLKKSYFLRLHNTQGLEFYTSPAQATPSFTRRLQVNETVFTYNANNVWHAGNDGAGSGLDADLLDGVQESVLVRTNTARTITAVHTFNPGTSTAPFILGANASGQLISGLNADILDGKHALDFQEDMVSVIIADDTATQIETGVVQGFVHIVVNDGGFFQYVIATFISSNITVIQNTTNFPVSTGVPTGTSGTDGDMTLFYDTVGDSLYIENRRGASKTFVYSVMYEH